MEPMTRETFEKHWTSINILGRPTAGVSFHPADGEALVEAKIITEGALPKKRRENAEEPEAWVNARSYTLMGLHVSFVPGIPQGTIMWVGPYNTVVAVTTDGGKLVNS